MYPNTVTYSYICNQKSGKLAFILTINNALWYFLFKGILLHSEVLLTTHYIYLRTEKWLVTCNLKNIGIDYDPGIDELIHTEISSRIVYKYHQLWEYAKRGSGWGTHVNPWPFHFNVWQNSLQIKKKKWKKKKPVSDLPWLLSTVINEINFSSFTSQNLTAIFWAGKLKLFHVLLIILISSENGLIEEKAVFFQFRIFSSL